MVQFYVDNPANIFFVRTTNDVPAGFSWDFNHPFFLLLNLAVGGTGSWPGPPDATTPSPAVMLVDYVRVYTASSVTAPTMTAPSLSVIAGQSASSTITLNSSAGSGRVYLSCSTNAPKAACTIRSSDPLNQFTVDFSSASSATASVSVTTTANTSAKMSLATGVAGFGIGLFALALCWRSGNRSGGMVIALLICLCAAPGCGGSNTPAAAGGGTSANGTPPGGYSVTVNASTVTNAGNAPDAVLNIPLTVN